MYILCTSSVHIVYSCVQHMYRRCTEDVQKMYTSYSTIIRLSLPEHYFTHPDDDWALVGRMDPIVIEQLEGKNLPVQRFLVQSEETRI